MATSHCLIILIFVGYGEFSQSDNTCCLADWDGRQVLDFYNIGDNCRRLESVWFLCLQSHLLIIFLASEICMQGYTIYNRHRPNGNTPVCNTRRPSGRRSKSRNKRSRSMFHNPSHPKELEPGAGLPPERGARCLRRMGFNRSMIALTRRTASPSVKGT